MARAMQPLQRHQLVWLDEYAWYRALASADATAATAAAAGDPWTAAANQTADCLAHWAQRRWPLVVTRQPDAWPAGTPDARLALGLAAPAHWGRRSIRVEASLPGVARQGEFPLAADLLPELPVAAQAPWARLCEGLARLDVQARVYGSYGWQLLTGMDYVHAASDIDLVVALDTPAQADRAAALLQAADGGALHVDGELAFGHGAAVAWREWLQFRSGQTERVLVKRLTGVALEDAATWAVNA